VSDAYVVNSGAHVQATVCSVAGPRTLETSASDADWDWQWVEQQQQQQQRQPRHPNALATHGSPL